jgi:tRNA threonylcarbamoyladenosine biosynthesis protein TsaE
MAEWCARDLEEMTRLGEALARRCPPPAVIGLEGPLGAGKTTLVRAVLAAMGHREAVPSPTYTLIESYALAAGRVHHLDLYRLGDPEELELVGIRDLASEDALWLVEWPERGGERLPPLDYRLRLGYASTGRRVSGLPADLLMPEDSKDA